MVAPGGQNGANDDPGPATRSMHGRKFISILMVRLAPAARRDQRGVPMRKDFRGLTLIEVLIIVVMIGILLTIVYQKTRGRTAKDVIASLKLDVESAKGAESKYFALHNAYGTRVQLDSANLITESPGNATTITLRPKGYIATAKFLNTSPITCTVEITDGEESLKSAKTICSE
jgi:Tfp pilus assembly protein PilE